MLGGPSPENFGFPFIIFVVTEASDIRLNDKN